jgi:hypothetical protein
MLAERVKGFSGSQTSGMSNRARKDERVELSRREEWADGVWGAYVGERGSISKEAGAKANRSCPGSIKSVGLSGPVGLGAAGPTAGDFQGMTAQGDRARED